MEIMADVQLTITADVLMGCLVMVKPCQVTPQSHKREQQ